MPVRFVWGFLLVAVLVGLIIGLAVGLTGVGGGVLTAPVLLLCLGLPLVESVGTALVFSVVVRATAAVAYLRRGMVNFRTLGWLVAGGVPGAVAGSLFLGRLRVPSLHSAAVAFVGAVVVFCALLGLFRPLSLRARKDSRGGLLVFLAFPVGVEVAFSSAGAGALGTLILFGFTTLEAAIVVGTDLVFGLVVAAVAGGLHLVQNGWNRELVFRLSAGGVVGAWCGSRYAVLLPDRILRVVVLVWACGLGLLLFFRGVGF